jgi:hypothetical protein
VRRQQRVSSALEHPDYRTGFSCLTRRGGLNLQPLDWGSIGHERPAASTACSATALMMPFSVAVRSES